MSPRNELDPSGQDSERSGTASDRGRSDPEAELRRTLTHLQARAERSADAGSHAATRVLGLILAIIALLAVLALLSRWLGV